MLTIYNTLTKEKQIFTPLIGNQVRMYVCGLTVYDRAHLGHARTYVAFDVIARYLRLSGYDVLYVRNITDVDDKIIRRAQERNMDCDTLVREQTKLMHEDFDKLMIERPNIEPRATDTIPEIISLIETLMNKGFAYATDKGDVYYRVHAFNDYGKLSRQNIEQLQNGVRIEPDTTKESSLDFALWKAAKPGEPTWESPWSPGRPGWHSECSAMSQAHLGDSFDIHGGGSDLTFPHHENEIAQSEAATGKPFASLWMHTGMIRIDKEKMSKSLDNFFTIEDILTQFPAEAVRYFLLSGHYRSAINYSEDNLNMAKAAIERLYTALRGLPDTAAPTTHEAIDRFKAVMDDDFNTPEALSVLFELAHHINRYRDEAKMDEAASHGALLKSLGAILGILQNNPDQYLQGDVDQNDGQIKQLIQAREQARSDKNWAESDRIRDELTAKGIILEDTSNGTNWRKE